MRTRDGASLERTIHVHQHGRLLHGQSVARWQPIGVFRIAGILQFIHGRNDTDAANCEHNIPRICEFHALGEYFRMEMSCKMQLLLRSHKREYK